MATGTINGTTSNNYITAKIEWTSTADHANNKSTVTATLYYRKSSTSTAATYGAFSGSITINGTKTNISKSVTLNPNNTWFNVGSATQTVTHNADGSKSITIAAAGGISGSSFSSTSLSGSVSLDKIARKATITSAPNFYDNENPTITYSNAAGNAVASLEVCISKDGIEDTVPYRSISKTGTSYTFNLTTTERNALRAAAANSNTIKVRFYIKTVIGSNTYYHNMEKTLTISNGSIPTLAPTAKDTNTATIALTGDSNKFVRYMSVASCTTGAAAVNGATIKSQYIKNGSQKVAAASATFSNIESGVFEFNVVDSRNNSVTQTLNKTIVNYVIPTVALKIAAPNATGELNFQIFGSYFSGSFGSTSNTITLQYRYKADGGSYGSWTSATPTISGTSYTADVKITSLNYQTNYIFQARIIDKLNTKTSSEYPIKTTPIFDWSKDDFNFNVNVNSQKSIIFPKGTDGIRGINSDGTVVLALQPSNNNDNLVIGYGNYEQEKGGTRIYGNNIELLSKGNITINGRVYGSNKILWSGTSWMEDGITITLSEAISKQPNGIVVVFSWFDLETLQAKNYNYNSFFIPKQLINLNNGVGHNFMMGTQTFNTICNKYLYISDTSISGHSANNAGGTGATGIAFKNTQYVLRYIIGV